MKVKIKLFYLLLPLCIFILGLLIRIFLVYKITIYPDDINFYSISLLTRFREIISLKYWAIDYPQGYFLITRLLILLSKDVLFLKVLNLMFYIISSILLYKLGRRLFNDKLVSLFPLALFSSSQFLTGIDISLNPYPFSFTLSIALIYMFIGLVDKFSLRKAIFFGLLITFSTFVSYALFFVIFALLISLILFTWKNPSNKKQYVRIAIILFISTIPSIFQLFQIIHLFSALSLYPSSLLEAARDYINSPLKQIMILPPVYFILPLFVLFFLPRQKKVTVNKTKYFLIPLGILISSIISLVIMERLGLNISTRLFFAFHLGVILLVSFLANKNSLFKQIIIYIILISFIGNIHFILERKTNKQTFEKIAKEMLTECSDPQTFYIIDSSNYYFYPLYHYYIPFSPYKTQKQYECILGHTSVFDTSTKQPLKNLPKSKTTSSYYFINLNQTGSMANNFISLCRDSTCYIFNARLERFENVNDKFSPEKSSLEKEYLNNLIIDEYP